MAGVENINENQYALVRFFGLFYKNLEEIKIYRVFLFAPKIKLIDNKKNVIDTFYVPDFVRKFRSLKEEVGYKFAGKIEFKLNSIKRNSFELKYLIWFQGGY